MTTIQRRSVALKILRDGIDTISLGLKKKDSKALEAGALWCAMAASKLKKGVWREKALSTQILILERLVMTARTCGVPSTKIEIAKNIKSFASGLEARLKEVADRPRGRKWGMDKTNRQARKIALLMMADGVSRINLGTKRKDKKMIQSGNFWAKIGALALGGSSAGGRPR